MSISSLNLKDVTTLESQKDYYLPYFKLKPLSISREFVAYGFWKD